MDEPRGHVSFRDPENFAYEIGGRWFRIAGPASAEALRTLRTSVVYERLTGEGKLIGFDEVDAATAREAHEAIRTNSRHRTIEDPVVFEVETVATVTYPWEWPNGVLAAAGLLTVEIREALLDIGLDLKDASAFNVQFRGSTPVFIDLGSVEPWRPNPSWNASRQFIEHFINPLAVGYAETVSAADAWKLSRERGVRSSVARSLMPRKLKRRAGLAVLQASTRPVARNKPSEVKFEEQASEDSALALRATRSLTNRLRKNVQRLTGGVHSTTWSDYGSRDHYSADDLDRKAEASRAFVEACQVGSGGLVLDIGGNDGFTAQAIAAGSQDLEVVVLDPDSGALDRLSGRLAGSQAAERIMALVGDLTNLTPASGLLDTEFLAFTDRIRPSAILCQAVLHHVVITQGVPLPLAVAALARFAAPIQIEFADVDDEKVRLLIGQIPNWQGDYSQPTLVDSLRDHYEQVSVVGHTSATRVVIEAFHPRGVDR